MSTKLSRREFLRFSALGAAGIAAVACQPKTVIVEKEKVVKETVVVEKEKEVTKIVEKEVTKVIEVEKEKIITATPEPLHESPTLRGLAAAGKLPPLSERMPVDALLVNVMEKIGRYGGDMRLGTLGVADGAIFTRNTEYENLVRWSVDWTQVVPGVAKSWEVQDDGKSFVFQLRKGMKWSDGEPFTADNVMFWYEEASNKDLSPTFSKTWSTKGNPVVVEKIDDYTVKFTYTHPYGLFLQRLSCPGGELFSPRHFRQKFYGPTADKAELEAKIKAAGVTYWYEAYGNWSNPRLVPDAPVVYAWDYANVLGDSPQFIAERNPYYWKIDPEGNQLPYLDRQVYSVAGDAQSIVLMAMAGEISYQDRHIATLINKPLFLENAQKADIRFLEVVGSSMNEMTVPLNLTHKDPVMRELFRNKDFRIALSHAINRQELIEVVGLGLGEPWQCAPLRDSPLFNETLAKQYTEFDLAKANQMLDQIIPNKDAEGYRLRPDGSPLGIVGEVTANQQTRIDMLELIKGHWAAAGIRMVVKSEDRSLFYERKAANEHDLAVWGGDGGMDVVLEPRWYFPYSEESIYAIEWVHWYTSNGAQGEEPVAEAKKQMELYDQLLVTPDLESQNEIMKQILQIAQEQFWVMGTYVGAPGYAVCKNKFRNVPGRYWGAWLYPNPGPFNPCQFYWES